MKVVVKIGGFAFPLDLASTQIRAYGEALGSLAREHSLIVVTGGGEAARRYIATARALGASEALCDQLGIYVTRLNAHLMISTLGDSAYPAVPESIEELRRYFTSGKAVVMGGLQPGHSTNATAALAAEAVNADILINATDVEGLYTGDPRRDPTARKLDEATTEEIRRILMGGGMAAGGYELMDLVAINIIERSGIPTWIIDGRNPENLKRIISGERLGTRIVVLADRRG